MTQESIARFKKLIIEWIKKHLMETFDYFIQHFQPYWN